MTKRILLIIAILLSTGCGWGRYPDSTIGLVDEVVGQPRVIRGDRYLELGPESGIELNDNVITGPADKVEVRLRDGTVMYLGRDAQVSIQEYSYRDGSVMLRLTSSDGRYRLTTGKSFKRSIGVLEISTPFATVVSGKADLFIEHGVDAASLTVVRLGSGPVGVMNQYGGKELLHPGDVSIVGFGLSPALLDRLEDNEIREVVDSTSLPISR